MKTRLIAFDSAVAHACPFCRRPVPGGTTAVVIGVGLHGWPRRKTAVFAYHPECEALLRPLRAAL